MNNKSIFGVIILLYGLGYFFSSIFQGYKSVHFGDFGKIYLPVRAFYENIEKTPYAKEPNELLDGVVKMAKKMNYPQEKGLMIPFVYHPVIMIILYPIIFFHYNITATFWLILNLFCLYIIIKKLVEKINTDKLLLIGFILLFFPTRETMYSGQMNFILILLIIKFIENEKYEPITLGTLLLLKPQFAYLLLLYLLLQKKFKQIFYTILFFAIVTGLCILLFGKNVVFDYFLMSKNVAEGIFASSKNQSIPGVVGQIRENILGKGTFFKITKKTFILIKLITFAGIIFTAIFLLFNKYDKWIDTIFCVFTGLLFAPFMWSHYMSLCLLLLPYFLNKKFSFSTFLFCVGLTGATAPPKITIGHFKYFYGLITSLFIEFAIIFLYFEKKNKKI